MTEPLKIALAGLGTVGTGVVRLIETNADLIARRARRPVRITAVSARDRTKDRGVDLSPYAWVDDPAELAAREDVDVVVEMVGGSDGPALALARTALANGKSFVTANKAMIAHHGLELAKVAEDAGVALKFEAAVAGGIPVINGLIDGASANAVERVYGILNGTCNYILSTMEDTGADFGEVLAEAQRLGYAEADPTFDIEGIDAGHKLSILAAIAFGAKLDFGAVEAQGIAQIKAADIEQAHGLGYVIRLIGFSEVDRHDGMPRLFQRVRPYLVPLGHPLANVDGPTNAIVAEGNFVGRLLFQGAGAGDGPTASAVVADIIEVARGEMGPAFAMPVEELEPMAAAACGHRVSSAYIRFTVLDRPGVLAEITAAMRDAGVSIESMIQKGDPDQDGVVILAVVTHQGPEAGVVEAMRILEGSSSLTAPPLVMQILAN
ncbi:homoserine dehydrogenase [Novosphingobium sp. 1949]|uniref:Homoserine dehydrogenase n=1 Tax=Novosphingobium organovorum TaxID=2930092 RepID=A0ABT0B8T1_9SPHN|nr:homoserine dehydrogenase [Novosphingobium organovorum]MCJ2181480.1 homoserine dehydrogenase [Novosphingobium organovorum]